TTASTTKLRHGSRSLKLSASAFPIAARPTIAPPGVRSTPSSVYSAASAAARWLPCYRTEPGSRLTDARPEPVIDCCAATDTASQYPAAPRPYYLDAALFSPTDSLICDLSSRLSGLWQGGETGRKAWRDSGRCVLGNQSPSVAVPLRC